MTKARSNATANAAKGDLTVGNGTNLSGVLGVGSNGDTIVADSSTSTGLRYQGSITAGKNFAINGGLDIWQRGTSFTTSGYSADRWNTSSVNETISRQSTNAPIGSQYYLRNTASAANAASDSFMYFESAQTAPLVGRTITISVKLRRNATFNASLFFRLDKSATVDAGSGATWTNITPTSGSDGTSNETSGASITTGTGASDWTTIYRTLTIPNDGTANSIRIIVYYGSPVSSGSVLDIAQLQVEIGSVPTTFSRAGGTIQGELAACQRYFLQIASGNTVPIGFAYFDTTSLLRGNYTMPVTMRTTPTIVQTTGTNYYFTNDGGGFTSISLVSCSPNVLFWFNSGVSGTLNRTQPISTGNASSFLGFQAEL
jgi:hypothetical protein